jgi:hypothetical protein
MESKTKLLPEYGNHYLVHSNGLVESLVNNKLGKREKPYALKQRFDKYGYLTVCLSKDCSYKPVKVHRIVAKAFIENPFNYPIVNHKNGIKTDNRVENLEWCTNDYNMQHAKENGLIKSGALASNVTRVIDTETGKIYGSIKDLWIELNKYIPYDKLRYYIKRGKINYKYEKSGRA